LYRYAAGPGLTFGYAPYATYGTPAVGYYGRGYYGGGYYGRGYYGRGYYGSRYLVYP
jgi:hypothetical protein